MDQGFLQWIRMVEHQVADMHGWSSRERVAFCTRGDGPRFVVKCALGKPGSNGRRLSQITVAWRTLAGWLTDVAQAFHPRASLQIKANARRAIWLCRAYTWDHLGDCIHAAAFRNWINCVLSSGWDDRVRFNWFRATALLVTKRSTAHDILK